MEKYNWPQQEHKNVLKKGEEGFLIIVLFIVAGMFIYMGFSVDAKNNSQLTTITTAYRQFSIVAHAYATTNHTK